MTTMAPAGEGGGGGSGTTTTTTSTEQAPATNTTTTTTTTTTSTSAPTQHPPPSPLSGCYLLVVLPEPHTAQHKDLILNRLAKGFLSWDKDSCHVDLEKELQALVAQSPEGEEARNGERLIQYATENLVTEVLIYPQSNTLLQCIRNLLASFTKHRHIIHAGYTFGGNGSWILQDGTFSLADFLDAFSEHEVQRVLRAYENSVTVDIHCAGVGDWTTSRLSKEACTRACRVRVNPDDVLTAGVPAITSFTSYIGQYLIAQTLDQLMEPSDVVGNIRFSHPTLYVFPGGQGDAALFGINGFNMLVDGGFARKACFWDFTRHLDRLDAVLVTRINNSNVGGMSSVLKKKKEMHVYPQIGHFFCNLVERRHSNSPDGDKDIDPLILNLIDIGQEMMVNLRHINLRPHPCYRDPEPINLYHKVGHGTLDMYVLSPSKDSREVREFLAKWNASDSKLFAGSHRKDSNGMVFPAQNLVSICALLVWQPANPEDTITRILFPGSTPQHKIFEGFERLKHLEFLKHPTCTAKSLSPSTSLMALKDKAAILKPKLSSIERETKRLAEARREKRDTSEIKAVKKDAVDDASTRISTAKPSVPPQIKTETKARKVVENKKIESEAKESKKIEKELKETKKEVKKIEKSEQPESDAKKTDAIIKVETEKTAPPAKEPKTQKIDVKKRETKEITKTTVKPSKPESMTKPSMKPVEKKPKPSGEKKDIMKPSPTTPKKSMNGAATKTEMSKTVAKSAVKASSKISTAAPAKSAKDANNRMVVEQKNIESAAASAATKAPPKPKAIERKPISRRTKPVSPSKARLPISPAKSTRSTPTASVKSEKDAVIRKVKGGTTDSSAVSTPSGIEPESAIKLIDKNLTEKSEDISLDSIESKVLADLKEEREVVEEIEAVLQKAERIEEARKEERFEGDDEITAEATDKKEEDMTEEDVTAEMDDAPKKLSRKESQELTEEDEYLIVEKEEIYTEDSVQSGDAEQKHHLDEAESEKSRLKIGKEPEEEEEEAEEDQEDEKEDAEEKKDEVPEKSLVATAAEGDTKKSMDLSPEHKELLKEEMKQIIASATEAVQKTEEKDDSGKKDSEDITKDPSSLSADKLDSSAKPDIDQKEAVPEKLEESQERISTLESGATTTAPTLPEDERIPLDEIKEDVDEKHVLEEVKEKEIPVKEKEVIPEALPAVSKPEVKVLDVKPPVHHGIARDVVKTPDEVADLPVHEEVDPKLYRMEELEKYKEAKAPAPVQESKEPAPTVVPAKEQKDKGMFSFFGKVADKFEKGIDKLTKKARRDSADKDAEDKSSKSSSPKESKPQEKVIFEDVDIDKVFPKVGKHEEKVESFEQVQPQVTDIKVAAIKETAAFLQEEIKDSIMAITEPPSDVIDKTKNEIVEDIKEVEALVEEASMKFKNVKDSLQDSLESLEDKVDEAKKSAAASADMVTDTLIEAAEKLVDIKSDFSDLIESKEPEKVKFIIPSSDDTEKDEDDSDGIVRDFKEAVRDVAEVLMGTTGIEIEKEEKPKDVEQIVKKVAEVLKEDDFLVEKTLFTDKGKEKDESLKSPAEGAMIPKKVGVTEEFATHEEVEEIPEVGVTKRLSTDYQKADGFEVHEEPCTKVHKDKDVSLISPARDAATDKEDAMRICEDLLKDDVLVKPIAEVETESRSDVMDLGLEEVCVKKIAKREVYDEQSTDEKIIVESEICFEQKLSPCKAELVTVTPGSTPTSPKLPTELELPELPIEYKNIFDKETSLENLIEEFIVVKKHKVTIQIIEYIIIVKRVPKEKVINIIQKTIIKHKIPRGSVADSVQVLRSYDIPSEKILEIENYITNEYLNKNKKITFSVIEEISMKETIPKRVVIEIVEEIIDKQISRESVFDIPEETYFTILREIDDTTQVSTGFDEKDDDKIVEGFITISSKDTAEEFIQEERKTSQGEAMVVDDSVAVEEEHKVRDIPSAPTLEKFDAPKTKDVEEVTEQVSDATEADEKFVKDTPEKSMKDVSESDSKDISIAKVEHTQDQEISEISEVDTNEKYLDEAKEKTTEKKDSGASIETLNKTHINTLEKSHADATGRSGGFIDVTKIEQTKDDDQLQDADKESHDGIVKRMVVTASSEDGGHETEICPSGTITFTKSPTPEDSLKEVDTKSTPEKDSLMLDKDSLRSAGSTPEKDSIVSDKSDQKDDKITPEDSLEKSETIADILQSKVIKTDETTLKELETGLDAQKSVGVTDQLSSIISSTEMAKTPDSLHSGDASPAESVFSKSPTEKAFTQATELFSHENLITEKIIDDLSAIADKSKSPSVEKEAAIEVSHSKVDAKSKSPSLEKELEKKDISEASTEVKLADISKSPIAEKEVTQKEMLHDALKDAITDDRSKPPSSEKEVDKKDMTPEVLPEAMACDRSKSPSTEKEISEKEMSPNLKEDAKTDRSKSPSVEKEAPKKEAVQELGDVSIDEKSKSPSVEKETAGKEMSSERVDDGSKSPTLEKEVLEKEISQNLEDIKIPEKSQSPGVEKESVKKEISPETAADDKAIDRSKSPSLEKEVAKSQVATDVKIDDKSKSPDVEKDTIQEKTPETVDRSKSPSLEKEIEVKMESEGVDDTKIHDKSKSPSVEKEVVHKEISTELKADVKDVDRSRSPSFEKDMKTGDRSKSSGIEKELAQKSASPALDAKTVDRSKSPSVEKESSPALDAKCDKSKSPSVEKETDINEISPKIASDSKTDDRSKLPSVEKETDVNETMVEIAVSKKVQADATQLPSTEKDIEKDKSPEIVTYDEVIEKSKSPSPEKEAVTKEISPSVEKDADKKKLSSETTSKEDIKDGSKLPIIEKQEAQGETLQEVSTDIKVDGRSKSPSVEKDSAEKEETKKEVISEIAPDDTTIDRSKSPSVEKDTPVKEVSPELVKDIKTDDRSKSPSIEKDATTKEMAPELTTVNKVQDKSKSPSPEKEDAKKETSPELSIVNKSDGKSKSPSVEKDATVKEASSEPTVDREAIDRSKSPSVEKEACKKDALPVLSSDIKVEDKPESPSVEPESDKNEISFEFTPKAGDQSKFPSVEKDHIKKEMLAEVAIEVKPGDKVKSPSSEKDVSQKETSSVNSIEDRSKQPSIEKDDVKKEMSSELEAGIKAEDKFKSPSSEKVTDKQEMFSELTADLKTDDRFKSPSVEKDADKKDELSKVTADIKVDDRSKSPSVEKDAKSEDRSKSPSVEKDADKNAIPSELTSDVKADDRSKSPSVEKDGEKKEKSPELIGDVKTEDRSKSPSVDKEVDKIDVQSEISGDANAKDKSKSPSVEKDADQKDALSDITADTKVDDRSKSPSVEKDGAKKEMSPELIVDTKSEDRSKSPSVEKEADKNAVPSGKSSDAKADDRSKSPSVEKDGAKKEKSPELIGDVKTEDRSKSPSVDKEVDKIDVQSETSGDANAKDKSKSPSVEKDADQKDALSDITADTKVDDRSKSPSVEKDGAKKEMSPELIVDTKSEDRSKSPNVDTEVDKIDVSSETSGDAKAKDKSMSPSVEKDADHKDGLHSTEKEMSPELAVVTKADDRSKSPSVEKDAENKDALSELITDMKADDRSKSPSVEKETGKKELSPELVTDIKFDDKYKSPSVEKDDDKKEMSSELSADIKARDQSKSPSPEKQDIKIETSSNLKGDMKVDRSKSPSVEKDTDQTTGFDGRTAIGKSKSPSIEKDVKESPEVGVSDKSLSDTPAVKSKSPSVEKDSKEKESPEKSSDVLPTDDKSKSPSVEKDTAETEVSTAVVADTKLDDRSKSPSLEKEKIESRSSLVGDKIDEFLDRKTSLTLENAKSAEKEEPAVQRASLSEDKSQKSRSPSVSGDLKSEAHDFDKSKSVSPVSEKTRADISLLDTADDRKSSIASLESHAEEKGKDRSRSHSLFETGDKTPLVRSRAASLYEDKIVEKLSTLEHAKDPLGHAHDIFEETDELRLSQEAINKLHAAESKEESAHKQDVTPETRKAIEEYIFIEYINKKKMITLSTIHEISNFYKIDQYIVVRIINEIISNQKITRETVIDFDDKEYEETNQKLLDDEEKLTNYINDEFIAKKKKINSITVDTIASAKSVSRHLVILVIENIISSRSLRRESIVDGDFSETHDFSQKEHSHASGNIVPDKDGRSRKESLSESLKPTVETKSMSPSPEPSLTYKLGRPDPHIDEEITISENKRIEVETLLIDEYITRGIKITETILEQIVMKTSLPKYIIIEIIEEILIKKHLSKDAIADKSIFHDDDDDSQHKLEYEGMATPEIGERKSSGYSTPDTRNYEAGLEKGGQYAEYESPFHKAFMGGMTEIRTTHITTLSGKSTPDFGQRTETPESISETTDNAKMTITSVPGQFESTIEDGSHQTSSASQSKTEETVQKSVKTTEETHSQLPTGETVVVLKTTQITTYPEETTEITKEFITRESVSDDDPSKKQIIEQDESETITKLIEHEVVHMAGEPVITKRTSISGGDYNQEFITRETTKTITSEKELDPVSLIDTFGTASIRKSVDHTETSSVSDSKVTDKSSTVSPSAINIEEKLISLDSHPSDTSKTSISSMSGHDSKADSSGVHEEKHMTFSKDLMDHTIPEQLEQSAFPLIRDLITDDKSYSGKSSPDVSLPKDIVYGGSTGKSTPDISMSPLMRDGNMMMQSHLQSGRSTPDKRSDRGSRTATPEGFRSGDVIRTIITTTRTMSDDGEIITTTQEVTEATNDKGETIVITEKTDVKVDERLPETKPIDIQRAPSASSDKEFDPTSPRSDLSSGHSRAATHMWGSSDERHTYSDEEQSSPPFSSSPYHQDSSVKEGTFKTPDDFASAAMSSSFYGELPEESIHFHTSTLSKTVEQVLPEGEQGEFSFKKFTVEKEFAGGHSDKGLKKYVDEADLDFEKALMAEKSEHDRGQESSVLGAGDFSRELEKSSDQSKTDSADDKKDPLAGWGSPLGLPSPKAPRKFNLRSPIQPCSSADLSPDSLNFDVINDWGEPMRLPSPAPTANEVSNKGSPGTPKKEKKQAKKVLSENIKNKKRSESPSKNEKRMKDSKNKVQPVYVDLTYVSHHGNSFYTALEFFKKVRARYYVFSGTEPSREVYDALLEAKKTWEDKDLEVTMIPTYDTDTLGYWVADNEEALAAHHIDLSPSASRCTINLQDHETSCSAYRLEF